MYVFIESKGIITIVLMIATKKDPGQRYLDGIRSAYVICRCSRRIYFIYWSAVRKVIHATACLVKRGM